MAVTINGSGQVPVQVISTAKTDAFTTTSTSFTDITGLSVSITPSSASNKILVIYSLQFAGTAGEYSTYMQLVRGSTPIAIGDANGSRIRTTNTNRSLVSGADQQFVVGITFLDSPATTSATTYKLQGYVQSGGTLFVNRSQVWTDNTITATTASTITVMEISG